MHILVVDDEEAVRKVVSLHLKRGGHTGVVAQNVEEALEIFFNTTPFDLLITDLRMKGGNGDTLIKEVRSQYPRFPIVVMSGTFLQDGKGLPDDIGVLEKPFTQQELLSIIHKMMERKIP